MLPVPPPSAIMAHVGISRDFKEPNVHSALYIYAVGKMLPEYLSLQQIYPLFHKVGLFQFERKEPEAQTETYSYLTLVPE